MVADDVVASATDAASLIESTAEDEPFIPLSPPRGVKPMPVNAAILPPLQPVRLQSLPLAGVNVDPSLAPHFLQSSGPPPLQAAPGPQLAAEVQAADARVRELREAALLAGPGAKAMQLRLLADEVERDPKLRDAKRSLVQLAAQEAAARRLAAARAQVQAQAAAETRRVENLRAAAVSAAQARIAELTYQVRDQEQRLCSTIHLAREAERQRAEVGRPLLNNAVVVTRHRAQALHAEGLRLDHEARACQAASAGALQGAARSEACCPVLGAAAAAQEERVEALEEEQAILQERLDQLRVETLAFAETATSELDGLRVEEDLAQHFRTADASSEPELRTRIAALETERTQLRQMLVGTQVDFNARFRSVFGRPQVEVPCELVRQPTQCVRQQFLAEPIALVR